jgi:phospholipase/carboxylesterase
MSLLGHRERPPVGHAAGALVFFHGVYGVPEDFLPFMDKIDPARRFHAFLPQGPYPMGEGRSSWIDPDSPERVEKARIDMTPVLDWLDALPYPPEKRILGGWSQGTVVAYAASLIKGASRPAAILALGGCLPRGVNLDFSRPLPPVLIGHGTEDEAVPVEEARHARDLLSEAGAAVTYCETSIGHEIDQTIIRDIRAFLSQNRVD